MEIVDFIIDLSIPIVLCVISVYLNRTIEPFHRDIPRPAWKHLLHPRQIHKVNMEEVIYAIIIVFAASYLIFTFFDIIQRKKLPIYNFYKTESKFYKLFSHFTRKNSPNYYICDAFDLIQGCSLSIYVAVFLSEYIKTFSGVPRPDFFNRCFPDVDIYEKADVEAKLDEISLTYNWNCTGQENVVRAGRRSFPSNNATLATSGLWFLSLYIWGKVQARNKVGMDDPWRFMLGLIPATMMLYYIVRATTDNWNHWADIIFGLVLGVGIAHVIYHLFYPSISSDISFMSFRQLWWYSNYVKDTGNVENVGLNKLEAIEAEIKPYHSYKVTISRAEKAKFKKHGDDEQGEEYLTKTF